MLRSRQRASITSSHPRPGCQFRGDAIRPETQRLMVQRSA
jgi:hypothetical protein